MPEYDAFAVAFAVNDAMHNAFQYWLSITFAIILTAHLARRHLSLLITLILGSLYVACVALFFIDYLHWLSLAVSTNLPRAFQPEFPYGTVKTVIRISLFVGGTLTAVSFLGYSCRRRGLTGDSEK